MNETGRDLLPGNHGKACNIRADRHNRKEEKQGKGRGKKSKKEKSEKKIRKRIDKECEIRYNNFCAQESGRDSETNQ
ncbi:hypothetical protein NXG61_04660 [Pectinatus haikarae]|uniref:hypothetical protein n=2 Tax=Pectinatus haikarae TaxID=349096 RepID=UPI003D8084DB